MSTVPGYLGTVESDDDAIAAASDIGLPVMIKASAGGGGKGMRIAFTKEEVVEGVRAARSEARSSFGDDRVFIERYIENPRHIEIQVLGDKHGHVIYLGERECSIQRRNQKIIEEAPSPALDADVRRKMGSEAVALAAAVGYDSAGTVEFIVDPDRNFYFLEMNTRLQVEHPVTEFITNVDLVEQMIRVAAGETLALTQDDIRLDGWAIESRLYAEDPSRNFLPSIGRLSRFQPPAEGKHGETAVRIDSGVTEGSEITIYYDPLIAKLTTHGRDRAAAIDAMADALDRFVIGGLAHNRAFLAAVMAHPRWREGRLSTSFIADEYPDGFAAVVPDKATIHRLAAVALAIELRERYRLATLPGRLNGEGTAWRTDWVVAVGDETLACVARPADDGIEVAVAGDAPHEVESDWRPGESLWEGNVGGEHAIVYVRRDAAGLTLSSRGVTVMARVMTPRVAKLAALMPKKRVADASKQLLCPMPGLVLAIDVKEGQAVRAGEPLAVVEAMKMENVLRAERDATVSRIVVRPGDSVAVDAVVMEFE